MTMEDSSSPAHPPVLCDFCGRTSADAGPMIEGAALNPMATGRPIAHICAHCVEACDGLFEQHKRKTSGLEKIPTPRELVAHLNEYIIGQERVVKKHLAVAWSSTITTSECSAARSTIPISRKSRSPRAMFS